MATKSSKTSSSRSKAKVVSNGKSSGVTSWLQNKWTAPLVVLAVVFVGAVTLTLSRADTLTGPVTGIAKKCLDNSAARVANGNKIQLYHCNGTAAQKWTFPGDGTMRVQGFCLDVKGASKAKGTVVQLYQCNGTVAQQWKAQSNGSIINPNSGMCLDDKYANTSDGNQIWIWPCNGTAAQKWTLPKANATKPAAPANLSGKANGTAITLNWTASSSKDVTKYIILRNSQTLATVGGGTTTYTDAGLTAGSSYKYQVMATNSSGLNSDPSATITVTVPGGSTTPTPPTPPTTGKSPVGKPLYVSPSYANAGRPGALSSQPIAEWFGDWTPNPTGPVKAVVDGAAAKGQLAQLVAYNITKRDCEGGYSAGGAKSAAEYKNWIRQFASGIGQREAIVILEPDALAHAKCLDNERYDLFTDAVNVLTSQTKAYVYLDAAHSAWGGISDDEWMNRLNKANIAKAHGFSTNVSNFQTSANEIAYGNRISAKVGGKPFVIDTSRNGQGPKGGEWCNPLGRGLGKKPTTSTGTNKLDAYLWIKRAGESDGTCNGGPAAGQWFEAYAQMLISNAKY